MTIFTDFLTYKDGLYHRTEDAFKFNGQHVVKIVGWDKQADGGDFWIVQNTWGEDWGDNGFVKILAQDKSTMLDFFAIGVAVYPMTMHEYYTMQSSMNTQRTPQEDSSEPDEQDNVDLDIVEDSTTTIE